MTNSIALPQPVLVPRRFTGPIAEELKLPVNVLGAPFIVAATEPGFPAWWKGLDPIDQKLLRDVTVTLAAPQLLADIRACYQQKSQIRTTALAGGAAADAPWIFFAPVREEKDYHVQPVPGRDVVVDSFMAYVHAGAPVWDSGIRFRVPVAEFAALIALADVYTVTRYAALLKHEPYPEALPLADLAAGVENIVQSGDHRFLFPAIAHLLPEAARSVGGATLPANIGKLVERGLMRKEGEVVAWTDGGLFFADSLHHRTCALALDIAGAAKNGLLATQGALFIRGDQVLWYCDIEPDAGGQVAVVSVSLEKGRQILAEILTPVGSPPAYRKSAAAQQSATQQPAAQRPAAQQPARAQAQSPAVASKPSAAQRPAAQPAAGAKFCSGCGTPVKPGARFCAKCGKPTG